MALAASFPGMAGDALSTLELISSFLDQQSSSQNAGDIYNIANQELKQKIQLALQGFQQRNELMNNVIGQTNAYQTAVTNGLNALGPYGGTLFDPSQLAAETGERYRQYSDDADAQIEQLFSTGMAGQMNKGIDSSTMNVDMRKAMAESASKIKSQAYTQAKTEALDYINGLNTAKYAGLDQYNKLRTGLIGEQAAIYSPAIDAYTKLAGDSGSTGAYLLSNSGASNFASLLGQQAEKASGGFGQILDEWAKDTLPSISKWFT